MAEALVNLDSLLPATGQLPGVPQTRGGASVGNVESIAGSAFQARLNALLKSGADGDLRPADTAGPEFMLPASVPPPDSAPQSELLLPTVTAGPAGNNLPASGNKLPPAAPALNFAAPGATPRLAAQSATATDAAAEPVLLSRAAEAAARAAEPARPAGLPLPVTPPAVAAGPVSGAPEPAAVAAAAARRPLPAPAAELLAEAQRLVATDPEAGLERATARPDTVLALARSAVPPSARQEVAATVGTLSGRVASLELIRRSATQKVNPSSELGSATLGLQARPADAGALPPAGALDSAAAELPRSFTPPGELRARLGTASWSAGLGQRLLAMAENGVDAARLRLHPANLGPLDIQIAVEDDRAQVWFGAQNAATRDALEAALPRLREMFAEQGLELAQADVGERQTDTGDKPAEPAVRDALTLAGAEPAESQGAFAPAGLYLDRGSSGVDIYV